MMYTSTQNNNESVSSAQAIAQGISRDGGLFVPDTFPKYDGVTFETLLKLDYRERAKKILSDYLTDFTAEEIADCVDKAYTAEKFGSDNPAPIVSVDYKNTELNILELWHGPTCAFKDMALQILPHLLTKSLKKTADGKKAVILVATSGDTGKAALEGFKDVENTEIIVFYPSDGVSPMQKHQMNTTGGNNVGVCAIKGNFDDAQTGVKNIFTTDEVIDSLEKNGLMFSSANSINWGRLLPQIVYYVSAYCDMVNAGKIKLGDKINIVVPTGNFGNILAAYFAYSMGMPVNKLICASNSNNVLTDFINSGVYNKNRDFITTVSPSMDILVSSNLERLLYILSGRNDAETKKYMTALKTQGEYAVSENIKNVVTEMFSGGYCSEDETLDTIASLYENSNYLCDTHTAVAVNVYDKYLSETGDNTPAVIASTASPYKFSRAVLSAVEGQEVTDTDEFAIVDRMNDKTGVAIPAPLEATRTMDDRFSDVIDPADMPQYVLSSLGLK
ncbi:MAG: threonine synthase [Clostridia bacterium]|nr:threonine synthase [Clostridia bacterium]